MNIYSGKRVAFALLLLGGLAFLQANASGFDQAQWQKAQEKASECNKDTKQKRSSYWKPVTVVVGTGLAYLGYKKYKKPADSLESEPDEDDGVAGSRVELGGRDNKASELSPKSQLEFASSLVLSHGGGHSKNQQISSESLGSARLEHFLPEGQVSSGGNGQAVETMQALGSDEYEFDLGNNPSRMAQNSINTKAIYEGVQCKEGYKIIVGSEDIILKYQRKSAWYSGPSILPNENLGISVWISSKKRNDGKIAFINTGWID